MTSKQFVSDFLDDLETALTRHGTHHHENASVIIQFQAGEWSRFTNAITALKQALEAEPESEETEPAAPVVDPSAPRLPLPPDEVHEEVEDKPLV